MKRRSALVLIAALAGGAAALLAVPRISAAIRSDDPPHPALPATPIVSPIATAVTTPISVDRTSVSEPGLDDEPRKARQGTPASHPKTPFGHDVMEAFDRANIIALRKGQKVPTGIQLPYDAQRSIVDAHAAYAATVMEIEKIRLPVLHDVTAAKRHRGEIEPWLSSRDAPKELSGQELEAWLRKSVDQKRPTKPDQTVVTERSGKRSYLIRINADEDPRLQLAYERLHQADDLYLQQMLLFVEPYRRR